MQESLMPREWPEAWNNQSMAEDAARVAKTDIGTDAARVFDGPPWEAAMQVGPFHMATMRELYYTLYSEMRRQRREQLEIPPGVPKEYV
jgi:hypothetical protein